VRRETTHGEPLDQGLLHDILSAQHQTIKRIEPQRLLRSRQLLDLPCSRLSRSSRPTVGQSQGRTHRSRPRVYIDDELAVQDGVRQRVVRAFPMGEMQVLDCKVALFPVDLGKISSPRSFP